jgi:hypothetical protein
MNYLKKYQKYQNKIGGANTTIFPPHEVDRFEEKMVELANYIDREQIRLFLLHMLAPHIGEAYFDYPNIIDTLNNPILAPAHNLMMQFGNLFFNNLNGFREMMLIRLAVPFA